MSVRIVGLADSFDAMTSARPYRAPLSVGSALSDLVRMAPDKFDPSVVQALLIQVRRDAVGSSRTPLLDTTSVDIAPRILDHLAATLQHECHAAKPPHISRAADFGLRATPIGQSLRSSRTHRNSNFFVPKVHNQESLSIRESP